MQTNVLDYFMQTVKRVPDKMAYSDGKEGLCFREVYAQSRSAGMFMSVNGIYRSPSSYI